MLMLHGLVEGNFLLANKLLFCTETFLSKSMSNRGDRQGTLLI